MRPLHRWPLLHTDCIGFLSRQVLRIAFFASLLIVLPHQTHATGKLTMTIWDWTASICCTSATCPKTCTYNFTVCIGVPEDNCNFGLLEFTVPHAVPVRDGYHFASSQPYTAVLRVEDDVQVDKNQILRIKVKANPSGVDVFRLTKIMRVQPGEKQNFKKYSDLTSIDFNLEFECDPNYYGDRCTVYCKSEPGLNHFDCDANTGAKKCHSGWEGESCTIPICESNCSGLGDCVAPGVCSCADGWLGSTCSQCQPLPGCQHGTCVDAPGTCVCNANWTGALCDQIADKCIERPCKNGGICKADEAVNAYTCVCPDGYIGENCEINKLFLLELKNSFPREQNQTENVDWKSTMMQNMGFWIFAIVCVMVAGLIIALLITQRKEKHNLGSASRVGRRNSDIEMDMLRVDVPKIDRNRHKIPPPYIVSELSPLELISGPAPPSYAEATAKQTLSPTTSTESDNRSSPSRKS